MFVMPSEVGGPHPFPVDSSLKRPLLHDESKLSECSSPRTPQIKADNESVRSKLRDSLTSALEMVVSKQLVKSVLGVVKDIDGAAVEDKLVLQGHYKTQDKATAGVNISASKNLDGDVAGLSEVSEVNSSLMLDVGGEGGPDPRVDMEGNEPRPPCCSKSVAKQGELQFEAKESLLKKLRCERGERGLAASETKGGLQLMDQAKRVARNVELSLFSLNGGVNKKYKEKARSLLFNLKDKSNPELRARVFNGEITPEILVRMNAVQLASKELSQWRTAKAEEFASMVVLTDADVDPRRIVKKTHKGEFQVVVEETDFSASAENVASRPASFVNAEGGEHGNGEGSVSGRVEKIAAKSKRSSDSLVKEGEVDNQFNSRSPHSPERVGNEGIEGAESAYDFGRDLPIIMSLDEYIDNHQEVASERVEESPHVDGETGDLLSVESGCGKLLTVSPGRLLDKGMSKTSKTPSTKIGDIGSLTRAFATGEGKKEAVWKGSIQISASRVAPINGFYKSGETLELKDWPKLVEVKGRVKLKALDKFLQDLQISRSRTVTILSLCPSDCQGDRKQIGALLEEMASQYRVGERAGFVEPKPGFELYLLAPGSASLELLSEDLRCIQPNCEREDEVLVGVVVWRKIQSQGPPVSRGLDQTVSIKKVASSNPVFESRSEVNAKPSIWAQTPSSRGAPGSAPSHVIVSGNSSMHATQFLGDSTASCDPLIHRDWQQPFSRLQLQPTVVPTSGIEEKSYHVMVGSRPLPHHLVEDVPPGFLPQSTKGLPLARSSALTVTSEEHMHGLKAPSSLLGSVPGQVCPVSCGSGVLTDTPPGFCPKSVLIPPITASRRSLIANREDDDDLPEFNFEAEGAGPKCNPSHLSPANQTQFMGPPIFNISTQTFTGVQHSSSPGNMYCHNVPSPQMAFQTAVNGFSRKQVAQQDEPLAGRSVPCIEQWDHGDVDAGETVRTMHHDLPRSMLSLNGTDRRPTLRAPREEVVAREEFGKFGHVSQRVMGPSPPVPSGFAPSLPPFLNGAHDMGLNSYLFRNDLLRPNQNALVSQLRWPLLSPIHCNPNLHVGQHLPVVRMVVQQQHTTTNDSTLNWPRDGPLPQHEARRHHWQAKSTSNPSKWFQSNAVQMPYRSTNPGRRSKQRDNSNTDGSSENNGKDLRGGRDRTRVRERSRELSLSPRREAPPERHGSGSLTPTREMNQTPTKDARGQAETGSELRNSKAPKRERERERDQ